MKNQAVFFVVKFHNNKPEGWYRDGVYEKRQCKSTYEDKLKN